MPPARILALTDLSRNSLAGLDLAERFAHRIRGRVVVGHVLAQAGSRREDGPVGRSLVWIQREDREHLLRLAARHIDPLRLAGVETLVDHSVRAGLRRLVERTRPDLVCMASHGRTGLHHLLLGSIAEHTIRTAGVPVMVTKGEPFPDAGDPLRVLVAVDLSDDPQLFTQRVAGILTPRDELILAHVVESRGRIPEHYGAEFALPEPDLPRLTQAVHARLGRVKLGPKGPRLLVVVASGRPGEALVAIERRQEVHLVAARTHGRRGFDHMMLGSVAEFLARKASCAVLIDPKPG